MPACDKESTLRHPHAKSLLLALRLEWELKRLSVKSTKSTKEQQPEEGRSAQALEPLVLFQNVGEGECLRLLGSYIPVERKKARRVGLHNAISLFI